MWQCAGSALLVLCLAGCGVTYLPYTPGQPLGADSPVVASTAVATGVPTAGATANGCAISPEQAQAESYLARLVNQHRADAGVPALRLDQTLSLASRGHSCDMAVHDSLSHIGSDGSTPGQRILGVGLKLTRWGENIGRSNARDVFGGIAQVDAWMMAEPLTRGDHHWNIVNPAYSRLGVGIIIAGGEVWFTEDFGG
jgi:uncharacterized protein YkwD